MARFRARARAVDMLGRQQIAGIPTAISELFKNAHDAYADHVEVDFWRSDGLLVLRDDGVGMSREDFQRRWLTLGTESKVGGAGLARPPVDTGKPLRPVLGEKGIGRLAIAAIGPQVLVLTRAKNRASEDELVVALIHWGFYQLAGVDLDEIDVPLIVLPGGELPDRSSVGGLVDAAKANLDALGARVAADERRRILRELDTLSIDPRALDEELKAVRGGAGHDGSGDGGPPGRATGLSLGGDGYGTQFYIVPTDESLVPAIDGGKTDVAPALLKTLVGFTNTMTPGHSPPAISTAFRDHKAPGVTDDLISERAFFTPEEFENADHHITGAFDAYGQFAGTVTVYGEPTLDHVVPWPEARGVPTVCGPFRISVATVQGRAAESTLPLDDWSLMTAKMARIGGLYIYRDGIRVLPYGNNDYDFLDIERNRTKSASDYYFSYRRMFGVIEISNDHNKALVEKAGREGFRENGAYRQFRDILKSFFVQIAADFFREAATHGDRYSRYREELTRLDGVRRRREREAGARRRKFEAELRAAGDKLVAGAPSRSAQEVLAAMQRSVAAAMTQPDTDRRVRALLQAESAARQAIEALRDGYRLVPPRGLGLPRRVRRDLDAVQAEAARLDTDVFAPALAAVERLAADSAAGMQGARERRVRFDRALAEAETQSRREAGVAARAVTDAVREASSELTALARDGVAEVDRVVKDVLTRAARLDVDALPESEYVTTRTALEEEVRSVADRQRARLTALAERLRATHPEAGEAAAGSAAAGDTPGTAQDQVLEALEDEVIALRERADDDLELVQMGMAIQVVNHEFDTTVRAVRTGIRELRAWADANAALAGVYATIRRNFEHLDSYLTFFTPLQRRLYRTAVEFSGREIARFLGDLFRERLETGQVTLDATPAFRAVKLTSYPSTFYPVFVNLVDNALHWVERGPSPRRIQLDARGTEMVVANTGPGISPTDREVIFERGFSRRTGGRGLGLYIARRVLEREGYDIDVAEPPDGLGAAFLIRPQRDADADGDPSTAGAVLATEDR